MLVDIVVQASIAHGVRTRSPRGSPFNQQQTRISDFFTTLGSRNLPKGKKCSGRQRFYLCSEYMWRRAQKWFRIWIRSPEYGMEDPKRRLFRYLPLCLVHVLFSGGECVMLIIDILFLGLETRDFAGILSKWSESQTFAEPRERG